MRNLLEGLTLLSSWRVKLKVFEIFLVPLNDPQRLLLPYLCITKTPKNPLKVLAHSLEISELRMAELFRASAQISLELDIENVALV